MVPNTSLLTHTSVDNADHEQGKAQDNLDGAIPHLSLDALSTPILKSQLPDNGHEDGSAFTKLPTELQDQIFDNLDAIEDVFSLAITCRQFWPVGKRHIQTWNMS